MFELTLSEGREFIESYLEHQKECIKTGERFPILVINGPPGIGKTEIICEIAQKKQYGLFAKYAATSLIEQFTGLPKMAVEDSESVIWTLPQIINFTNLTEAVYPPPNKDSYNIVLFDDIHLAKTNIQNYMFQLFTYRAIHNHKLPDNCLIIAAGNGIKDKAGAQKLLSPVANRMYFLNVKADVQDWIKNYASKNDIRSDIIAFLQGNEHLFCTEPISGAFASPRSWTYASNEMNFFENHMKNLDINMKKVVLEGHVGTEVAGKFIEFVTIIAKWDAESIMSGKTKINVDDLNPIDLYSLLCALCIQFIKDMKESKYAKTEKVEKDIKLFKKLVFKDIYKKNKVIVPMGLRLILLDENNNSDRTRICDEFIGDDEILKSIADKLI